MSTGREEISGVQEETESSGLLDTDAPEIGGDNEYNPKESAAQTAERILKGDADDQVRGEGKDNEKIEASDVETKGEVKQVRGEKGKGDDLDPELSPPERLNAAERKLFINLPTGLRRGLHRMVKNLEAGSSKSHQEYTAKAQEVQSLRDAAMPFAGEWAEKGRTVPQAIAELGAFQRKLSHADLNVREETYLKLAKQSKIDLVKLANRVMGNTGETNTHSNNLPDISNHPLVNELKTEINSLREQIAPVQSLYQQQIDQQFNREVDSIVSEVETVRNEIDPTTGNSRYPELFDQVFLDRVKPLVSELRRNVPGMSWGGAYKEAHRLTTGRGNPQQANQTRPPASTNGNTNNIAQRAAISVRGKATPSIGTIDLDPPPEALKSAQATMDWVMRNYNDRG